MFDAEMVVAQSGLQRVGYARVHAKPRREPATTMNAERKLSRANADTLAVAIGICSGEGEGGEEGENLSGSAAQRPS